MIQIILVILTLIIDRVTKLWAIAELSNGKEVSIIKNFFNLTYLENRGAAFSIFEGKVFFLTAITLIIVILIIVYLIVKKPKSILAKIAFPLIIGGALGNLYDRIFYNYVVDFIHFYFKSYSFPVFNFADVFVVVGTALLAIYIIKEGN